MNLSVDAAQGFWAHGHVCYTALRLSERRLVKLSANEESKRIMTPFADAMLSRRRVKGVLNLHP